LEKMAEVVEVQITQALHPFLAQETLADIPPVRVIMAVDLLVSLAHQILEPVVAVEHQKTENMATLRQQEMVEMAQLLLLQELRQFMPVVAAEEIKETLLVG
jgi:hypothetical protein